MKLGLVPLAFVLLTVFLAGCPKEQKSPTPIDSGTSKAPNSDGEKEARRQDEAEAIQKLLAGLPKDKQPKPGADGVIERNEAKEWLVKNVVGKPVGFTLRVGDVEIEDGDDGKYNVELNFVVNSETLETQQLHTNVKISQFKIGGIPCQVQVWGPEPLWSNLDPAAAKKKRELNGQLVTLQGRVTEAEFLEGDDESQLLLMLGLDDVTVIRSQKPEWVKIEMPEGPCTAMFPGEPQRFESSVTDDVPVLTTQYGYNFPEMNGSYSVGISQPTPEQLQKAPRLNDAEFHLKESRDRNLATTSGKLVKEKPITLGNYKGLEFTIEYVLNGSANTLRQRTYYDNGRIFQVVVASEDPTKVSSQDADKFLDSFILQSEKATPTTPKQTTEKANDWVKITDGPLTILFPVEPERVMQDPAGLFAEMTLYTEIRGDMVFAANIGDDPSPANIRAQEEIGDEVTRLKLGQQKALEITNARILSERPIRFGNNLGLEYTDVSDLGYGRTQAFIFEHRAATITVASPNANNLTGADAERFFDSFRWNGKSRREMNGDRSTDKPITYAGKRYQVFSDVLSWQEAKAACKKMGGELAVVNDANQNHFLAGLVIEAGLKEAWLGATDESDEGNWVRMDGAPLPYTNWGPGQPNNTDHQEHYLLLWAEKGGVWSDQPSHSTAHRPGYICQWE